MGSDIGVVVIPESAAGKECITQKEAMTILHIDSARVSRLCNAGRFPGAFQVGRTWLIPRASVENYQPLPRGRQPKPKRERCERANGEKFAAMLNSMELSGDA